VTISRDAGTPQLAGSAASELVRPAAWSALSAGSNAMPTTSGTTAVAPATGGGASPSEMSTANRPAVVRTLAAKVHVMEPEGFNDAQDVGDRLKAGQPVILNLQGLGRDLQRRLIDFSSGLAYAVGGSMSRVADQVFLLTPTDVEVSDEEKERLQARGLYRA